LIGYLILAHKNLHQLTRLIRRLQGERSAFFVHVDVKTDMSGHEDELRSLPRVTLAEERRFCPWGGGLGLIGATRDLMKSALRDPRVRKLVVLSGQDYPIKAPGHIESFHLAGHPEQSFIENFRLPRTDWGPRGGMGRIEDFYVWLGGRYRSLHNSRLRIRRKLPYGLKPYQGGQLWSMSRECAEFVLGYTGSHPRVERFFKHARNPSESFFQTIVMNSPMAEHVVNDDLRFELWEPDSDHPEILTTRDMPAMRDSRALIAKKFDTDVDAEVLDLIDQQILDQ